MAKIGEMEAVAFSLLLCNGICIHALTLHDRLQNNWNSCMLRGFAKVNLQLY